MRSRKASEFAEGLLEQAEAFERSNPQIDLQETYSMDPVGFLEDVLDVLVTDDIRVMCESVRDNEVTYARSGNATGKTHAAGCLSIWWYKCKYKPQVYTTAAPPESNLKNLLWGEIGAWTKVRPDLFDNDKITSLRIESTKVEKSWIVGVLIPLSGQPSEREARFSGKHAPNLLFIIDEGDGVPGEVYKGIESCMSGGNARLLVLFNPREPMGRLYEMQRKRTGNIVLISALTHPNVTSGDNIIPGAVTRETTVRRIHDWTRSLMKSEPVEESDCFQVPEYLVDVVVKGRDGREYPPLKGGWRKIVNPAFSYMVLAKYPKSGTNQLIHPEWVDEARKRWDEYVDINGEQPPPVMPSMGQDVADIGDDWNVVYFRYDNFVSHPHRWKGVDVLQSAERGAALAKMKQANIVYVDGTGVGSAVAPKQRRMGLRSISVKMANKATVTTEFGHFSSMRDQVMWGLREWLRTEQAMLPPEDLLIEELTVPDYEIRNGKIKVMDSKDFKDIIKRSPDDMSALALTFAPRRRVLSNLKSVAVKRNII